MALRVISLFAQLASGKAGKTAKDLLKLPGTDFSTTGRPILFQAIQQRAAAEQSLTR
jgi:hypothetical protein